MNANKDAEIENMVKVLKRVERDLCSKPRRLKILNIFSDGSKKTSKEISRATGISSSALHYHLEKLYSSGFVHKSSEWPAKYSITDFTEELFRIAKLYISIRSQKAFE